MTEEQSTKAIIIAQTLTNRFKRTIRKIYYSSSTKLIYIETTSGTEIIINQRGKAKYVK